MIGDAVTKLSGDVADNVTDRVAAVGLKLALFCASGVAACGAVAAAAMAMFWWLLPQFGPVQSALLAAAALIGLALMAFLTARRAGTPPDPPEIKPLEVLEEESREAVDSVGVVQFVLAAAGIGALIGMKVSGNRGGVSAGPSLASIVSPAMSLFAAMASKDAVAQTDERRSGTTQV